MAALSRIEKERLCLERAEELQRIWRNPPDPTYDAQAAVRNLSDEKLDKLIRDTVNQIRFEKALAVVGWGFKGSLVLFVALGVFGLLLFGIRYLFR